MNRGLLWQQLLNTKTYPDKCQSIHSFFLSNVLTYFLSIYRFLSGLPTNTAPRISKMVPRMQACFIVSTLAPTEEPNEFATSFAPMPNASKNATMNPTITIHSQSWLYSVQSSAANILQTWTETLTWM